MEEINIPLMIGTFLGLMFTVCGTIIYFLRRFLISETEGAVKRLDGEIAKTNEKQVELEKKLKDADEELEKRRSEASELANKMQSEAEEASKAEREKIIASARTEGEEIIAKAQGAKEMIREELEKKNEHELISVSVKVLTDVLSQNAKGAFEQVLVDEFLEQLKETDMSKISPGISSVDVVSVNPINEQAKNSIIQVVNEKLGRTVTVNATTDDSLGGGLVLKFGSMALDGSLKFKLQEIGIQMQEQTAA